MEHKYSPSIQALLDETEAIRLANFQQESPPEPPAVPVQEAQTTSARLDEQLRAHAETLTSPRRPPPAQRRTAGHGQHVPPQLRREDALNHESKGGAKADGPEQPPKERGIFSVGVLRRNPFLSRTYEPAALAQGHPWNDPLVLPHPRPLPAIPRPANLRATIFDPHELSEWNMTQLRVQHHQAEVARLEAELAAKYPNGLPADYDWCVDPGALKPEETKAGKKILKWLADVPFPQADDFELDEKHSIIDFDPDLLVYESNPQRTPSDYQDELGEIPSDADVAGVNVGLQDIRFCEAARFDTEGGNWNRQQLTYGREKMSAHDTCAQIYKMYEWKKSIDEGPMGAQPQAPAPAPLPSTPPVQMPTQSTMAIGISNAMQRPAQTQRAQHAQVIQPTQSANPVQMPQRTLNHNQHQARTQRPAQSSQPVYSPARSRGQQQAHRPRQTQPPTGANWDDLGKRRRNAAPE
ncbi:hypothetical protein PMZ80_000209 [Knufia obscura]|uniref:Uncharacterized protein n=1 Tax=Knufia obscura TaxID=1635080 RepID=A0ABR0S0P1_9EURO|nr:hypothetical protein PMZ80_000209 [Knufia obscura]